MGKISDIFNFNNIGTKIKNLVKWSCWFNILLIWVCAPIALFVLLSDSDTAPLFWIPLVAFIVGPILVWIGSWTMYAFGEFVEDMHAVRSKCTPTAEELAAQREAAKGQLRISDFEEAVSAYLKRPVAISEIACTLIYVIPASTGVPKEMHLDMSVGDQEFTSLDLFFNRSKNSYYFKGRQLALDGACRSEKEIFAFDVNLFKSFDTDVDDED